MALLESNAPEIGQPMPAFRLPSVHGEEVGSNQFTQPALVVMFLCGHCPYVLAVEDRILALARDVGGAQVGFVAICSNDPTDYPEDSPSALARRAAEQQYPFPYLVDADQTVAKAFDAVCTPEFYLYNAQRQLAYHGRLDDNWQNPADVQNQDLRRAIQAVLTGQPVPQPQFPSMGCSIKWKG